MKTLIFSDSHASHIPNPKQLALLRRVILDADRVIINGDFWDHYLTSFDQFIQSGWKQLFPLLKQRKTVYILGNHDPKESVDERWRLFANQVLEELELRIGTQKFKIEHGHRRSYAFDLYYPNLTKYFSRFYPYLDKIEKGGHWLTPLYQAYLKKAHDDHELRQYALEHKEKSAWHVFSHTHQQRKVDREGYLNPGQFRCGVGNWLTISDTGVIQLHSMVYHG